MKSDCAFEQNQPPVEEYLKKYTLNELVKVEVEEFQPVQSSPSEDFCLD